MDKQDAIKCLKSMQQWIPDWDDREDGLSYWDAIDMAIAALSPPNEPLSIEQLREMDGEPVYVVSAIGERPAWYIVDLEENELKNPWDRISLDDWDDGYPYTAYHRPPEGEEEI